MNKFVFVIPYFNCVEDIEKTMFSMVSQSNTNWRAIMINDMSTDGSDAVVKKTCRSLPSHFADKFSLIDNERKHGEVENTVKAIQAIDNEDVVCRLDGGDWLTENDLLHVMDGVYSQPDVAVAWTAHRWSYTSQNISGPMNLKQGQTVYQHPWVSSHLKTFRCKYLKKVPEANFKDEEGKYIMIACDQAIFLPMMHVASNEGMRLQFVPMVGYHYNIDLNRKDLFTNERSIRQKTSAESIRERGFIS